MQQGDQQVLEIGGAASAPSLPETKTVDGVEYVFDGWYTDEACTDQSVTPDEVSATTTFYARYVQEATLTYDANAYDEDGEAVYDEVTDIPEPAAYRVGEEVAAAAPHRTGYAFTGWNTAADGSGTPYAAGSTVTIPEGGITLYAQWAHAQVNVTYYRNYDNNDANVLNQETADADSQGTIWDSVPTRNGYVFRGWATSRGGEPAYYPGATYETGEANILLYAQWGQVADVSVSVANNTVVYNGQEQTLDYTNATITLTITAGGTTRTVTVSPSDIPSNGLYEYYSEGQWFWMTRYYVDLHAVDVSGTDAGTYRIPTSTPTYSQSGWGGTNPTGRYAPISGGTLTIDKKPITITTPSASKVYDGTPLTADEGAGVTGIVAGETYTFTVTGSQTNPGTSVNTYKLRWDGTAKKSNYAISTDLGSLTVGLVLSYDGNENDSGTAPEPVIVALDDEVVVAGPGDLAKDGYEFVGWNTAADGSGASYAEGSTITIETVEPITLYAQWELSEFEITYDLNGGSVAEGANPDTYTPISDPITLVNPTREGYAFVGWTGTGLDEPTQAVTIPTGSTGNREYTANWLKIVEVPEGAQLTYNASEQTGVAEGTGYTITSNTGTDADDYTAAATLDEGYIWQLSDGTTTTEDQSISWSIAPKPVTVSAIDTGKIYGADDPELEASVTGTFGSDTVSYSISREAGEDVGEYDITVTGTARQGNYLVTFEGGTFTISVQEVTVTVTGNTATVVYDGEEKSVIGYEVAIPSGVDFTEADIAYSGTPVIKETNAGTYMMGLDVDLFYINNSNYDVTFQVTDGSLEITPAPLTVKIRGNVTFALYDGTEKSVSGYEASIPTGTTFTENDIVFTGTAEAKGTMPGRYTTALQPSQFSSANGNYDVTFQIDSDVILDLYAYAEITADNLSKPYGDSDPELTATIQFYTTVDGSDDMVPVDPPEGLELEYTLERVEGEDVGEYAISVDSSMIQNYCLVSRHGGTFTITPRPVTVTATDTGKTYGDDDPTLEATVEGTLNGDTVSYDISRAEGEEVDEYDITVTGDAEQGNYAVTFVDGTFTISPREITVTIEGNTSDVTYNGEEQEVTGYEATIPSGADFTEDDIVFSGTDEAKGTDVGTYDMGLDESQFSETNDNYDVTFEVVSDGSLTIEPKAVTVTAQVNGKTYGDDDPTLEATVEGTFGNDTISYSVSRATGEDVGDYDITVTGDEAQGNYVVTFVGATFTIDPREITVTIEGTTGTETYNGDEQSVTGYDVTIPAMELVDGATAFAESDISFSGTDVAKGTNYGEYPMGLKDNQFSSTNDNYDVTFSVTDGNLSIERAQATVTAQDNGKTYGDDDPDLEATVEGTFGNDTISYSVSRATGENVGEYDITASGATIQGNYEVSYEGATFTIDPREITVTIEGTTGTETYNGDEQSVEGYDVTIPEMELVSGATAFAESDISFSGEAVAKGTDVDTYDMGLDEDQFSSTNDNFDVTWDITDGWLEIEPLDVTVTITGNTDTVTYDATEQVVEGYEFEADSTLYTEGNVSFSGTARIAETNAGTYYMGLDEDQFSNTNDNFNVTFEVTDGWLKIEEAELTVSAKDGGKTYGDADPTLEYEFVGLQGDDTATTSIGREAGQDVGTYVITPFGAVVTNGDGENANSNYTIGYETATFTISPKAVTVTATDAGKTYGDADPTLETTVDGLVGSDTVSYSVSRAEGEDVGTYAITPTGEEDQGNYVVSFVGGTFTIDAKAITVTIAGNTDTLTYNADEQSVTGYEVTIPEMDLVDGATAFAEGDIAFEGEAVAKGTNVGTYDMGLDEGQFSSTNDNYAVTFQVESDGQLEITRAPLTITANKLSYDYNGEDQGPGDATFEDPADIAILVSVDGLKGNDAITSIAVDGAGRDVGEYDLVPNNAVVGNATGNYEISYANNVMAIEPLKVTVTITGSVNSLEYDGEEHQIEGYEVEISDELYTESDIDFSGTAVATGTDAGTYAMSLDESQFSNTNYNFDVAFDVADGQLEITPATPTLDAGPNQTATVGDPVSQPAKVIGVGNDGDITADFTITYTSTDESVATVDENGNVTIVGEGTATITATVVATSNPNYELPEPASWTLTAEPVEFDYYCAAGNHGTWTKGSDSTLDFTFKRTVDDGLTFERFTGILVDGQAVDPSNYVASAGSVDISLSAAYLETLAVGDHTITATFEDGEAEASFTVVAKGDGKRSVVPKTADPLSLAHVLAQAGAGLALVAAGVLRRRRDDE